MMTVYYFFNIMVIVIELFRRTWSNTIWLISSNIVDFNNTYIVSVNIIIISSLLVLMEDHWKALNENVLLLCGNKLCHLLWNYLYLHVYKLYFTQEEGKEDYDNNDISLGVLFFWQISDWKKLFIPYICSFCSLVNHL